MRSISKDNKAKSLLQKLLMRKSVNLSAKSGDEGEGDEEQGQPLKSTADPDHVIINIDDNQDLDLDQDEVEAQEDDHLLKSEREQPPDDD